MAPIHYVRRFTLSVTDGEVSQYRQYLLDSGVRLDQPLMLVGVTAKLASKVWREENMIWVLRQLMENYPQMQFIFNYAPGTEEQNARRIFQVLGCPSRILIDVQAKSARELFALASFVTLYFGNEGGARHIVHAAGKPSFVICAPSSNKDVWLPQDDIPAKGIAVGDVCSPEELSRMTYEQQYDAITPERVWHDLQQFLSKI